MGAHIGTDQITLCYSWRSSVEYVSLCDNEEVMFLAALGVHTAFLAANLILGGPLWSVDEKYSDARLIVFTSVLAIVFRYVLEWHGELSCIEQRQSRAQGDLFTWRARP